MTSTTEYAIVVDHLTHQYPTKSEATILALNDVCFQVRQGQIFGILGPNGGGKSTLFRIITTLQKPTQGQATVFGYNVATQSDHVRSQMGVVFQMPSLDIKLTARENLRHHGELYGLHGKSLANKINDALKMVNLTERADDYVEAFSGGMRRRIEIAKAMLPKPRVLLLDEPDTGLDPSARHDLWAQLRKLCDEFGITIILTTHLMEEAERCDQIAILDKGTLVACDTPDALKTMIGGDVVTISPKKMDQCDQLAKQISERFAPWPSGGEPTIVAGLIRMEKPHAENFIAELGTEFGFQIQSITLGRPTLNDVFMHMTGRTLADAQSSTSPLS